MSSRWGQHVPRSHPTHLCSACVTSGHSASSLPHPVDSSVRKFIRKLGLCSLPLAPALIPGASDVPGTTPQGNGCPVIFTPPTPSPLSASVPQAHTPTLGPEQAISWAE